MFSILGLPYTDTSSSSINRVYQALKATSVIYCIFAGCIIGLGTVRGMMESDLDLNGRPHEYTHYFMFALILLQGAWWIIMVSACDCEVGKALPRGNLCELKTSSSDRFLCTAGLDDLYDDRRWHLWW